MGGVIGCTHVEEGAKIRENLKEMFFFNTWVWSSGGKAEDVAMYLNNGNGGVVSSPEEYFLHIEKMGLMKKDYAKCARQEAIRMRDEIKMAVLNRGNL